MCPETTKLERFIATTWHFKLQRATNILKIKTYTQYGLLKLERKIRDLMNRRKQNIPGLACVYMVIYT